MTQNKYTYKKKVSRRNPVNIIPRSPEGNYCTALHFYLNIAENAQDFSETDSRHRYKTPEAAT